jgi:hypothetical protein
MTFEWEVQWFSDLSGVHMFAYDRGYELCVQFDGAFGHYSVWVTLDCGEEVSARVAASTVREACDIGEAIVEQWACDRAASLWEAVGL